MFGRHRKAKHDDDAAPLAVRLSAPSEDGAVSVELQGSLDAGTVDQLEEALRSVHDTPQTWTVLDLRKLDFIDSTGLKCVVRYSRSAQAEGRTFRVIRGPEPVHRVFELTGADALVEFVAP